MFYCNQSSWYDSHNTGIKNGLIYGINIDDLFELKQNV